MRKEIELGKDIGKVMLLECGSIGFYLHGGSLRSARSPAGCFVIPKEEMDSIIKLYQEAKRGG